MENLPIMLFKLNDSIYIKINSSTKIFLVGTVQKLKNSSFNLGFKIISKNGLKIS